MIGKFNSIGKELQGSVVSADILDAEHWKEHSYRHDA